jgi:hypothetical protein
MSSTWRIVEMPLRPEAARPRNFFWTAGMVMRPAPSASSTATPSRFDPTSRPQSTRARVSGATGRPSIRSMRRGNVLVWKTRATALT